MRKGSTVPSLARCRNFTSALCALLWVSGPLQLSAEDLPDKLRIFGHLTQAYAESSLGSILGATKSGTTELNSLAVQFRWSISDRDAAVIQLAHENRSNDIFSPIGHDVEVDWAFYERRIGRTTALKVGRLNVPLGIYNEVLDVGTLLPFFHAPISFYSGVLNTAETVDGISISHIFAARSDWNLEAHAYYGGWDTAQQRVSSDAEFGLVNLDARAEDGVGVQLWLNTPTHGVRLGGGYLTWRLDGPNTPPNTRDDWESYHVSLDVDTGKWLARAEWRDWSFEQDLGAFLGLSESILARTGRTGRYCQLGAWFTPRIGLFGQFEDISLRDDPGLQPQLRDFHQDAALSANYRFRPDLVAKVEVHRSETRFPLADPSRPQTFGGPEVGVDWLIASLSVSF